MCGFVSFGCFDKKLQSVACDELVINYLSLYLSGSVDSKFLDGGIILRFSGKDCSTGSGDTHVDLPCAACGIW